MTNIRSRPEPITRSPQIIALTQIVSEPLDNKSSLFFQHIIGVMRWMVEFGRVDIAVEVSLLSSYLANPREGHLEAAIHIMGYLRLKHNT